MIIGTYLRTMKLKKKITLNDILEVSPECAVINYRSLKEEQGSKTPFKTIEFAYKGTKMTLIHRGKSKKNVFKNIYEVSVLENEYSLHNAPERKMDKINEVVSLIEEKCA